MTNLDKVHLCYINPKRIQITLFQKCYPNKNHHPITPPSITNGVPLKNRAENFCRYIYKQTHSISNTPSHHHETVLFIKFSSSLSFRRKNLKFVMRNKKD